MKRVDKLLPALNKLSEPLTYTEFILTAIEMRMSTSSYK